MALDASGIFVLADGRLINLAAAEAIPRALWICRSPIKRWPPSTCWPTRAPLGKDVHRIPRELDREIARLKLQANGHGTSTRSRSNNKKYLASWDAGT